MTPTPYDAWTLRRLLCGDSLNGELANVSAPFRPTADLLAATPANGRQALWAGFLTGQPNGEEINQALLAANPIGPPPEADLPADEWLPLRLDQLPPVEPFPSDVLPASAARLVIEGAAAIGCPPDFLGLPVLAVAGGVIGRSVALLLKHGYFVGSTIYAACIGPPSDGKTPALKAVAAAARAIDNQLEGEYAQAFERWKSETAAKPKDTRTPPPPKPRRIDIDDATIEVLPMILEHNPRGLVMIRDELSALLLGMNQYKGGKGYDRASFLKIWSGDRIVKDRVNYENSAPIRCPHPALSIVGGLTPDMLAELADPRGRADGFVDRFLFAYPDPLPVTNWSDRGIPDDLDKDWCSLIFRLWERGLEHNDGRPVPHVAYFTADGKARWEEQYNSHAMEMNSAEFAPTLRGPWGKLREYAARLTLILTLLNHAADPMADSRKVPQVSSQRVDDAWRLIRYFKSHARRTHAAIACGPGSGKTRAVKAIVDWIRGGGLLAFKEHDVKQARRWMTQDDLADALVELTARNAIRPGPAPQIGPKGGRPSSNWYDVNPTLLVT